MQIRLVINVLNSVNLFREFWPVVHEISFKRFLIWSSGNFGIQWSINIYAILVEGIMGNIHVKLF